MFNIEMEYMKSYAEIASKALMAMALVWEQMQFNERTRIFGRELSA